MNLLMKNLRLQLGAAAALLCSAGVMNAEQLHIDQPGFEADGAWRLGATGLGVEGLFADAHGRYIDAKMIDPVPNRDMCLMYNNGRQHDVYQVLKATVQANTTYTLTIVAIDPTFADPFPGGELRLGYVSKQTQEANEAAANEAQGEGDAASNENKDDYGLNLLKPIEVDQPMPKNDHENDPDNTTDGYVTWTFTYKTGDKPAGLGQPLRIEILGGGKAQAIFDNVGLTAEPVEQGKAGPAENDAADRN